MGNNYFVVRDGIRSGPFEAAEILRRIDETSLKSEDLCWQDGMDEWQPIATVFGRRTEVQPPIPTIPKGLPSTSKSSIHFRLRWFHLFGLLALAAVFYRAYVNISRVDAQIAAFNQDARSHNMAVARTLGFRPDGTKYRVDEDPEYAAVWTEAKAEVTALLIDPASAVFDEVVIGKGAICGVVNSKNRFGGYVGPRSFAYDMKSHALYIVGKEEGQISAGAYGQYCPLGPLR